MREDLAGIPDGGTLRTTASGLEIIRRRKHEPIDLEGLPRAEQRRMTDKRFGSKFSPHWSLARLTDWIAREIETREWTQGSVQTVDVEFEQPVGVVTGRSTSTIRIMSDGRYVHAFPV